jgi:hypothetical protein
MIKESTKVPTIKITDGVRIKNINLSNLDARLKAGWKPVDAPPVAPVSIEPERVAVPVRKKSKK